MQISLAQTAFAPEFVRMVHAKRSLEPGTRSRDAVLHQSTLFELVGLLHNHWHFGEQTSPEILAQIVELRICHA